MRCVKHVNERATTANREIRFEVRDDGKRAVFEMYVLWTVG